LEGTLRRRNPYNNVGQHEGFLLPLTEKLTLLGGARICPKELRFLFSPPGFLVFTGYAPFNLASPNNSYGRHTQLLFT